MKTDKKHLSQSLPSYGRVVRLNIQSCQLHRCPGKATEIAESAGRLSHRDGSSKGASSQSTAKGSKDAFIRCWTAYKSRAWMADEVMPLSGATRNYAHPLKRMK
jgi:hypothetical protein